MIHYTCDRCKRHINPADEAHYVVQIEIQSSVEGQPQLDDDDIDQLSELHQALEGISAEQFDTSPEASRHSGHYDLCPECHRHVMKNPLGRDTVMTMDFSNN